MVLEDKKIKIMNMYEGNSKRKGNLLFSLFNKRYTRTDCHFFNVIP